MKPSLDDLYLFAEIANAGGLIRGAKRLGIPKSTVSRRLAQLERDIGARLIDRDARHFEMTDLGKLYAERAYRMVEAYSEAQEALSERDAKPRGVLRVAMPADFAIFFLSDAITSFSKTYPSVTVEIEASPQLVDIVGERFDLAVRIGKLPDSSLVAKPLASLARHFYAAPSFIKTYGSINTLESLSQAPFISLQTQAPGMSTLGLQLQQVTASRSHSSKDAISFKPQTIIKTNSIGLTRALALAGAGVALLPDLMSEGLVRVAKGFSTTPAEVHFILPQRLWLPAKTRMFIQHLQLHCAKRTK